MVCLIPLLLLRCDSDADLGVRKKRGLFSGLALLWLDCVEVIRGGGWFICGNCAEVLGVFFKHRSSRAIDAPSVSTIFSPHGEDELLLDRLERCSVAHLGIDACVKNDVSQTHSLTDLPVVAILFRLFEVTRIVTFFTLIKFGGAWLPIDLLLCTLLAIYHVSREQLLESVAVVLLVIRSLQ